MALKFTITGSALTNGTTTPGPDAPIDNPFFDGKDYQELYGQINVTAVGTGITPTLDLYVQSSIDAGNNWQDIAHFQWTTALSTQMFAIGGRAAGPTTFTAKADGTLANNTVVQGPFGSRFRVKAVVAGVSGASYSYVATLHLKG